MNQTELNYLMQALGNQNDALIKDIIESDTFKKKARAEEEKAKEAKKNKKEKSE